MFSRCEVPNSNFRSGNGAMLALAAAAMTLAGCATLTTDHATAPASGAVVAVATPNGTTIAPKSATAAANAPTAGTSAPTGAGEPRPAGASGSRPASSNAAPSAIPPIAVAPGAPKPFAEVTKDAKELPGLIHAWQKDDKTWLEIGPDQFDKLYFFTISLSRGLGEKWFFGGLMWDDYVVSFHKVGTAVQLIARNQRYFAKAGTPEARAVEAAFADSLLASAPIVSQPHPDRKSVLIDASNLLMSDIPAANSFLERMFRQSYSFDARNSNITLIRQSADQTSINVSANYALGRISQPAPGASPAALPPTTVPDIRSLMLGFYYNFTKLPDEPMHPRLADDRIGYFATTRFDYTSDTAITPRINYVNRWRLEKKDPAAALSEPKQQIVFWLDRSIPERYRPTVVSAILEWNKAFERIGFKDAIAAKVQPDDADWDTLDARHASVRWILSARPIFAGVGNIAVDPRTGEILDADVGIDPVRIRNRRLERVEAIADTPISAPLFGARRSLVCERAEFGALETAFALDLLEARGAIEPDSPEAEEFVLADLKETVMHEIGHVLGLTHNFRASTVYSLAQLSDPEFTRANGIAGSVMEYNPANIALTKERQGAYSMSTIGPYDYWAIEYGYKEVPVDEEAVELKRIAARSSEPLLAFAQDGETASGIDPDATQGDLGADPLEFAARRLALARELWDRWEVRAVKSGESYAVLRRNLTRGLDQVRASSAIAAKYIGGVSVLRDHAGSPRAPLTPIPMAKQRAALKLIESGVFAADSFRFKPEFMRRLAIDYFDRADAAFDGGTEELPRGYDYSLPGQVLALQREVLGRVMSERVAQRLLDSEAKLDDPTQALKLSELYGTLHRSIWSELKSGKDIPLLRRNLQREHATRIATYLLRPSTSMPTDARAVLRADARLLRAEITAAQSRGSFSPEARAHLAEALATLDEALKSSIVRQGV
jgi:hypothetical protein